MSTSGDAVLAADLKEIQLRSKVMIARVRKLQNENEKAKTGPQRLKWLWALHVDAISLFLQAPAATILLGVGQCSILSFACVSVWHLLLVDSSVILLVLCSGSSPLWAAMFGPTLAIEANSRLLYFWKIWKKQAICKDPKKANLTKKNSKKTTANKKASKKGKTACLCLLLFFCFVRFFFLMYILLFLLFLFFLSCVFVCLSVVFTFWPAFVVLFFRCASFLTALLLLFLLAFLCFCVALFDSNQVCWFLELYSSVLAISINLTATTC